MRAHLGRRLMTATALAGILAAVTVPALASPGPGSFTKITTPSRTKVIHFDSSPAATDNHFTVSGSTSLDVTSVDIDCILYSSDGAATVFSFAPNVPVTGGSFSSVADVANFPTSCRLRAIPTGSSADGYVASYSGPLLYAYRYLPLLDTDHIQYGFDAIDEQRDGLAVVDDAATCGVSLITTIATPSMQVRGPGAPLCLIALASGNVTVSGIATGSAIQVDGHNVFLPGSVHNFLIGTLALPLTQSKLKAKFSRASNGDITVTESAPLMRCNNTDTYPPTSCSSLVSAGVSFGRTITVMRSSHQVRLRDTFTLTGAAAHHVSVQYQNRISPPATGAIGYTFPGHSTRFAAAPLGHVVTKLGAKAGTIVAHTDFHAVTDDPTTDTFGLTWSRGPSKVQFDGARTGTFGLSYSLKVAAHKAAYLGFAATEDYPSAGVGHLVQTAIAEMVSPPRITSPAKRATVHGKTTKVKGEVTVGANGLPTSVTVNGHKAHLVVTKRIAKYKATFRESYGKHRITVKAIDSAGNSSSRTITVHNVRR